MKQGITYEIVSFSVMHFNEGTLKIVYTCIWLVNYFFTCVGHSCVILFALYCLLCLLNTNILVS